MIKYLSVGWGVPLFPSTLARIGELHEVTVRQLTWDLNPFTTFEVEGDSDSIAAFMSRVGAEEAAE